jgi:hypothetical protein
MTDLSIFLIHSIANRPDDVIKIRPIMDQFRISFYSPHSNILHFMYCTEDETFRYVDDLMQMLPVDREPYSSLQFNFPCFPSVLFRMAEAHDLRYVIRERLSSLLGNWPEARALVQPIALAQPSALAQSRAIASAPVPVPDQSFVNPPSLFRMLFSDENQMPPE